MDPPSRVLLNRRIAIEYDAIEARRPRRIPSIGGGGAKSGVPSRQDRKDAVLAYMRMLKPAVLFADPPELSSLHILRPTIPIPRLCGQITSAYIASADKNLLALLAGPYHPGSNFEGGYLIYNASQNSLSMIPQPPYDYNRVDVGRGTVVMCLEDGGYVLAELTKVRGIDLTEAVLCTWQSSAANWVVTKVASFPSELSGPNHIFVSDTSFSYQGSILCWVDLFKGMVVCDLAKALQHGADLEFRFVPLPGECPTYDRCQMPKRPLKPDEFRSMACVGGSIKFVTMDGYGELPGNEVTLSIWTLLPDLCSWKKGGKVYHLRDIWESESHLSLGLPQLLPSFPVLGMDKDGDVVYLIFTDLDMNAKGRIVEFKSQYLLRVDMQNNKVSHHKKSRDQMPFQHFRCEILASECSAYLHRSEDRQERVKARKVGEKRVVERVKAKKVGGSRKRVVT